MREPLPEPLVLSLLGAVQTSQTSAKRGELRENPWSANLGP